MSFNEKRDFNEESYVRVNVRLAAFWERYSEGRIETDFEMIDGRLIVIAKLYRERGDEKPAATGHAFLDSLVGEKVGEATETTAVGRALAFLGFQVEKSIASSEEMQRFQTRNISIEEVRPSVPHSLKPSRVFKPLDKPKQTQE